MIKEIGKDELRQALDLVNKVFSEFVAVDYYERLGFVKTGEMQEGDGILFIPMECRI